MWKPVALVGLALALLCGLAPGRATADDAEVRYITTNGGVDVGGKANIEYFPAGKHDGPTVTWANSGGSAHMPEATYNVHVTFGDGAAHKELWLDNQAFTGKVEKTVEVAVPMTEVRYVVTNGGVDVGGKANIEYFPAGKHDGSALTWTNSGGSVRMPEATYNAHVTFSDGTAHKELWFDNQAFTGKVEKTVEVAVPMTEVRYVVTNGGVDVGGKANIEYFPAGKHDGSALTWANSGGSVRMPVATYNVHLTFEDGTARKELWFDNQAFAGNVEKTVEVAVAVTEVRYIVTNHGADVGGKANIEYFPAGKHDGPAITWANSGGVVRMPVATYNVRLTFEDGTTHKELWFDNQAFAGNVEKTVEVAVAVTEVRYVVTNHGADVGGQATVEYFPPGKHDGPAVTWANSGGSVRMAEGTYNVHVTFTDGTAHREKWFDDQAFAGKVEKSVEIGVSVAAVRYVVTNAGVDVGGKATIEYFPAGKHDGPAITWANSGGTVRMPEDTYNTRVTFVDGLVHKEIWLDNQAFADTVDRTVELGITLAQPTVTVTQAGVDLATQASVTFVVASAAQELGTVSSGQPTVIEAGTYDIRARFAAAEAWLRNAAVIGSPHLTIDLQPQKTLLKVTATRGGNPLPGAWCGVYAQGKTDSAPLGRLTSGAWQEGPPGTYDIGCTYEQGGSVQHGWRKNQALAPGKTELSIDLPAATPTAMTLAAPGPTPEQVAPDKGDFPYLPPVPGSKSGGGRADTAPVYVQLPDAHQPELVANGSIIKWYQAPDGVSVAALTAMYHEALLLAGWTIVSEFHRTDAGLTAHYGRNGRNIWANIHIAVDGYGIAVADATIVEGKLAADLGAKCHLALTGVLFDFDKSTLKPESDAVLAQVSTVLTKMPSLRLDVQGHTDNVGTDAYNQPLSEARARSVVLWLRQHGAAADRLSAHGFGKTRPIVSNDTVEGRARNRRVEIADPTCKAKGT